VLPHAWCNRYITARYNPASVRPWQKPPFPFVSYYQVIFNSDPMAFPLPNEVCPNFRGRRHPQVCNLIPFGASLRPGPWIDQRSQPGGPHEFDFLFNTFSRSRNTVTFRLLRVGPCPGPFPLPALPPGGPHRPPPPKPRGSMCTGLRKHAQH